MIYVGHLKTAIDYLRSLTDGLLFEEAPVDTQRAVAASAGSLVTALDAAISDLDRQMATHGGLASCVSGAQALDVAAALKTTIADTQQMALLCDLRGYAGRMVINVKRGAGL